MNRNRITKFLFGGFALVILILALVFSLISCEQNPVTAVADSVSPATITAEPTVTDHQ